MLALAWSMKLHGAAAMAGLYLLGMLWGPHIRNAWVRRRNRAAGAVFGSLTAVLVVTGYALYYVNGELPRQGRRSCIGWRVLSSALRCGCTS